MSALLSKDFMFLVMQFLEEEKLKDTLHQLERESGVFFNSKHLEELVLSGNWDEVERYLHGFTKVDDNRYSVKIFFEIRKQKYLEELDRKNRVKAVDILVKDLKVFSSFSEDLFKEITQLITLDNFRENEQLSGYKDIKSARAIMLGELKRLIEENPVFRDKLQFPNLRNSRLRTLINQSLNWQHSLCQNPQQNPDIRTLFVDHTCRNSNDSFHASGQLIGSSSKVDGFLPIGANAPFQPSPASLQTPLSTWISIPLPFSHPAASVGGTGFGGLTNQAVMPKGPGDSNDAIKTRFSEASDKVMFPGIFPGQSHSITFNQTDHEIPKIVARTLNQGSAPTSMDFHPIQQTLLLVGTNMGEISLWEVSSSEKLVSRNFQIWDISACSMKLKATLLKDPSASVKRILWSPDGSLFGVAYSKHMMQLYTHQGRNEIRLHVEIDAHVGSVNDIAFCNPIGQLYVITCGEDKAIKVWEVATGSNLYVFEGHEASVHSVCPHSKENVHFVFSTSIDGKIKAWLYDTRGSRVDYDAPGRSCTTMAYSTDGKRLFSCGTNKDGESHVVEWNENEGTLKRAYNGFQKRSLGVVQFDTIKNRFLAVADDYTVKIWDMDNVSLLTVVDAEGGLPAIPRIRFNKEGTLLAISSNDNRVKVLATPDGLRLMHSYESQSLPIPRVAPETVKKNVGTSNLEDVRPRSSEGVDATNIWKASEISETAQLQSLRLSSIVKTDKILRLTYTNSGNTILALASNAIHVLWKWAPNDHNLNGKAMTKVAPHLLQPASGMLMMNDLTDAKSEDGVHCFALSKNDSYLMSASGGKISLFNMTTLKMMTSFMSPPPVATYIAFHPQDNNIIAIGMDDSTIHMHNVRTNEIITKLKGHSERITGLAFSTVLNTLVSAGADSQVVTWNLNSWEKRHNNFLHIPAGRTPTKMSIMQVQYHQDQIQFLLVHETQLALYETSQLDCLKQWVAEESSGPITHATYSCDSQLVFASFRDGAVRIFDASSLHLRCRINPTAYLPYDVSSAVYPLVVAAHPFDADQFAIGLTDGGVIVFEPLESEWRWAMPKHVVDNSLPLVAASASLDKPNK